MGRGHGAPGLGVDVRRAEAPPRRCGGRATRRDAYHISFYTRRLVSYLCYGARDDEHEARLPGRPRALDTDVGSCEAVLDLVNEVGVAGVTVTEVAARAGVARATVYLRWPSKAALIGAATKAVAGGEPFALTRRPRSATSGAAPTSCRASSPRRTSPRSCRSSSAPSWRRPGRSASTRLAPNRERLAAEYRRRRGDPGLRPRTSSHTCRSTCSSGRAPVAPVRDRAARRGTTARSSPRSSSQAFGITSGPNRKRPGVSPDRSPSRDSRALTPRTATWS